MELFLTVLTYAIIAISVIGLLYNPTQIGKERKPLTAGEYSLSLIVNIILIGILISHLGK